MNCLGCVVERDARPPIRMAKKTGDRTKRPTSCLFYFFTLKSLFTFLLFYLFTFKSLFTFLLFYLFTFKSLFTFLLFYFFTFKSLFTFLLFYSFTFLLLNHSPPQLSTSSSVSPGVTSFTLKLSKVLLSLFTTLALFMQTSSIWITYIAGVIYSFFIFPLYFFTFFPFTIYIPSGRPSSDEPLRTRCP